jgi:V8-like Glu-specific endopeptidase
MYRMKIWKLCMVILLALMMSTTVNTLYASSESSESGEVPISDITDDQSKEILKGPSPSVKAEEVEDVEKIVPSFRESYDGPAPRPNHPPIDQIPPMPTPAQPPEGREMPLNLGPGEGVFYDLTTWETTILPNNPASIDPSTEGKGGGYNGTDGGSGIENLLASFGTMTRIDNVQDFPWRMNVKLVMRFGSNWYVCSGTMRDAEVALTAGHCVYDYGGEGWADEIYVYPAYDGDTYPIGAYGYGYATQLGSWTGWTDYGDFNYDIGIIAVGRAVGMLTGWFGWAYGGSCDWHLSTYYYNASYPAEDCGTPGLHNGRDMYFWSGYWYSCPTWNRLRLDTTPGCFTAAWGGMSGSGAYYIDADSRYVHTVASTSDRAYWAEYTRQWDDWVNWNNNTFIPVNARGSAFDLQPLDVNAEPTTVKQGGSTTLLNHLATNPTNGSASGTWTFDVYISTNDNISTADTLLSTQWYDWDFGVMSSVRVNMVQVQIPYNTPIGDYWIGLIYRADTDGNYDNNDTDGWDAVPITVSLETDPPTPNPMTWYTYPYQLDTSQIRMVATTASDPTPPIQYYFDFYSSPTGGLGGTDSGWQASTSYTDSGLSTNHQYGYRVKTRDGNNNETGYSAVSYEYTDIEASTGITFGTITTTSIQARSTNTPSGLTRGSSGIIIYNTTSGTDSGWKQDNNYWTSSPLSPNTQYGFTALARNGDADMTPYSPYSYKYTLSNTPGAAAFTDITQTSIRANWTANGNPAGTQYFCENITAETNSGWTTTTSWNSTGLTCGTSYSFRVKARNGDGVETGWTSLGSQSTLPCAPPCEGDFNGDKDVDGSDLAVFAADFGRTDCGSGPPCEGDFDKDGDVDGSDLAIFAADFGRTDCP